MDVVVTGASGRVGTAVVDGLEERGTYEITPLDREPHPDQETVIADITDEDALVTAFEGQDAVVHLAADPHVDAPFDSTLENNLVGTYTVLEAAAAAEVESVVFASTYHTVATYEIEVTDRWADNAAMYDSDLDLPIDHTVAPAPDSYYGVSKLFGENLGRYYVDHRAYPERFYAWRICAAMGDEEADHPYVGVERAVEAGRYERGSPAYENDLAGAKAKWFSRRDIAHMADCMLRDEEVDFDVFYGVSGNERRWYDIEHARDVIGYEPRDDASEWEGPPDE